MSLTRVLPRVGLAVSGVTGVALLWAASVVHFGNSSADPATAVAEAQGLAHDMAVAGWLVLGSMCAFLAFVVGLAATVKGRGRTFTVVAASIFAIGAPSHVIGGMAELINARSQELLSYDQQLGVAEVLHSMAGIYFLWIVPFLLGLVLVFAAMWRARIVSWGPLALILGDIVVVSQFTGSTTPSDALWFVDPVITVAAFVWAGIGLLRYRPAEGGDGPDESRVDADAHDRLVAA